MRSIAVSLVLAASLGAGLPALAKSPYDTTYSVSEDTPVRAGMSASSAVKTTLKAGTKGIVMRWCRPEFPFDRWEFGNTQVKRALLKERWCEIESGGVVGNVEGKTLRPE